MPVSVMKTVRIASGTALSTEVDLDAYDVVGIYMPAAWTAADLTFQAADRLTADGGVYQNVFINDVVGGAVTEARLAGPAAGQFIAIRDNFNLKAIRYLRIRSGTSAVPVNQAADRIVQVVCENIGS